MFIHEMTKRECLDVLEHTRFGRLACARDNQPYVIPLYFAYRGNYLYSFATMGKKIEWMRTNPLVCVEMDTVTSPQAWTSVIVYGRYEELPDTQKWKQEREQAYQLLQRRAMWWQPAYAATTNRDPSSFSTPIFYRIHILEMTGHRAIPDQTEIAESAASI